MAEEEIDRISILEKINMNSKREDSEALYTYRAVHPGEVETLGICWNCKGKEIHPEKCPNCKHWTNTKGAYIYPKKGGVRQNAT